MAGADRVRSVVRMLTSDLDHAAHVNGVRLHYKERGSGAAILCIHGVGSSLRLWEPAMPELARFGRVICYDRRGYGHNERPEPNAATLVAEHSDDAAALLDALGATPAVVIGRSYGGEVAIDLALRHPGHVRALVLLEGVPESLDPAGERWLRELVERTLAAAGAPDAAGGGESVERTLADAHRGVAAAVETCFNEVLGEQGWAGLPDQTRRIFIDNGPGLLADLRGDMGAVELAALARIDKPTLLVSAADSPPPFRRANEKAAAAIPDARTALVGGGHLIDPADQAVLAFVGEVVS